LQAAFKNSATQFHLINVTAHAAFERGCRRAHPPPSFSTLLFSDIDCAAASARQFGLGIRNLPMSCTASSTSEDSNLHIPKAKNPFELSHEFPQIEGKSGLGDFCTF
jgi:hypothetical protein